MSDDKTFPVRETNDSQCDINLKPIHHRKQNLTRNIISCLIGLCVFLLLVCGCLIALLIILHQRLDTDHVFPGLNRAERYSTMASKQAFNKPDVAFRLPKEVKPHHYDVYLHPDLLRGTYTGKVEILIELLDTRNYIALHQKDLKISETSLTAADNYDTHEISIKETYKIDKLEELVITTNNDIGPGLYKLILKFEGALQPDKIVGFYASTYKDAENRTKTIATSKFEPTYARRAFPCFDEPEFKAEFSVKLVHPTGDCYGALSNMNIEKTDVDQPSTGLTTVSFARSQRMSTYLACFIISDFVAVSANAKKLDGSKSLPISVYTTRTQKDKATFALDTGIKIIEYYTQLFQIDYPLPKLDMAAIPDFVSGAMENWGLITYREARLLYDDKISSSSDKENVVLVIAHEFAHMWFGNLVTMAWWNDLWLNEGFASYMEYKSSSNIFPEWDFMDKFLISKLHPVFITDAKLSSHPIVQTVNNPDEITAIFDVITYDKGASVLRMLENFVGADVFITGVREYLNLFKYGNAETSHLFEILQQSVKNKINITAIMDTWTRQMGYPVILVEKSDNNKYIITQKRFLIDPEAEYDPAESDYKYKWTIPITYITDKSSIPNLVWFNKDDNSLEINMIEPVDWIKINHNQVGYYRVNYSKQGWHDILQVLTTNHKSIESVSDRTSLIEDTFSLAEASQLDYSIPMSLTRYLKDERRASPWQVAASKLLSIDSLLFSTSVSPKFREYVRNIVKIPYGDVTWQVDSFEVHDTLRLRTTILNLACAVGYPDSLDEAGVMFKKWVDDEHDVRPHPDIRSLVYKYGMSHIGNEPEWNIVFNRFVKETNANEKLKLMRGLAAVQSPHLLNKLIDIAVNLNYVRSQDTFGCLIAIARNPVGNSLVWDWVRKNWDFLVKRYTLNDRYLGQLVPAICQTFASDDKLHEMLAFFDKYPDAGAGKTYRIRAIETVKNNIKWVQNNSAKLDEWLNL